MDPAVIWTAYGIFTVVIGIFGGFLAGSIGRDGFAWFFICLLFGIFGLLALAIVGKPAGAARPAETDSAADEISKLADLHAKGALSAEEFAAGKAKALGVRAVGNG